MLSDPARDLVTSLLQPAPERRATVKLALNHRWIKGAREDSILDGSVMEGWADPGHVMPPPWMASRLHSNLNCALPTFVFLNEYRSAVLLGAGIVGSAGHQYWHCKQLFEHQSATVSSRPEVAANEV